MGILTLTTYDDVRAVLGVTVDELEDSTLTLELYANHLDMELEDIAAALPAQYTTVAAIAENLRTAAQQKFYRLTRLFATYSVARQLISGLPMFGPKDISDGKALVSRFADSPYTRVADEVRAEYDRLLIALGKAYGELISQAVTVTTRTYAVSIGQGVDRVTGS